MNRPNKPPLRAWGWLWLAQVQQFYGVRTGLQAAFLRAEQSYSRALALHPELQVARYLRGILYWRELHRYPAAITDLTLVLDSFSDAIFIRGMAYQALGDYEQAVQDLETFLQTAPTSRYAANAERQLHLLQAIVAELPRQLPDGSSPLLKG